MSFSPLGAANAYSGIAGTVQRSRQPTSQDAIANPPEFVTELKKSLAAAENTTANAASQIGGFAQGQQDLQTAVTALAEADVAIKTLVGVRDQVISAYRDIMRMQI